MSNNVTVDGICNDILDAAWRCCNRNIGKVFISSIACSFKAMSNVLIQQLNDLFYKGCIEYVYNFVDNGAVIS